MRYQERIYVNNDISGIRNKHINNANMSSDFCVFQSPKYNISGATKLDCQPVVCNFSAYNSTLILSAATQECISGITSPTCLTATTWETRIYENSGLTYTNSFYTTNVTGDTPVDYLFFNTIESGLTQLDYTYTRSGNTFVIDKKIGVSLLEIDVCLKFGIEEGVGFACPVGFSATPSNDACQQIIETGATFNGSGIPIPQGEIDFAYGDLGVFFYTNIQNNPALPLYYSGTGADLTNQNGVITPATVFNNTSPFWVNTLSNTGRLNLCGLSAVTSEWRGFTYCIDIPVAGTYYIGMGADNFCQFGVDGQMIVNLTGSTSANFRYWSVFEYEFTSGKHIINMLGRNNGSISSFGAEIYYPLDFNTLTGATDGSPSQANIVFTTNDFVGGEWEIGTSVGYSCPSGFELDGCGSAYTCTKIITTGITTGSTCSGICEDNCTVLCSETFNNLNANSQGIYLIDPITASTIPITFNFTSDTASFLSNNTKFKYELYKYNNSLNVFTLPSVYSSEYIEYSAFSATNIYTTAIPLSGIPLDGDFIIKGYFESDICTLFLNRLGKKLDTIQYKYGSEYQLYDDNLDYYLILLSKAAKPIFTQSQQQVLSSYDALPLYQQVIFVDDSNNLDATEDDTPDTYSGNTYERTGSTFTLNSEYIGDVVVTLNGLTLAKDFDYTLSGTILTFNGIILNGDVITIIYTRTSNLTIISETIQIDTPIVSGSTGNQGNLLSYFNTTTGKYEVYTNNEPIDSSRVIIMLNGVTLINGVDFYQSTTNPRRFILAGVLMINDIITIVYYPTANIIDGITQDNNVVNWYIETEPQLTNGFFTLEVSTGTTFSTFNISDIIDYQPLVTDYSGNLNVSGDVGTKLYYRVKNTKKYEGICGDIIESIEYSEVVPIIIQSNSVNSY